MGVSPIERSSTSSYVGRHRTVLYAWMQCVGYYSYLAASSNSQWSPVLGQKLDELIKSPSLPSADGPWYDTEQHLSSSSILEYYTLVTIPAGARSIHVYEMNISHSYIAVRGYNKKYHLNGHWIVDWPGRYRFAGSVFEYRRPPNQPEVLSSSGPTNESLVIEVCYIML